MYDDKRIYVNFSKFDELVLKLKEQLRRISETNNHEERNQETIHAYDLLFWIYNHGHGLDILNFCENDGKPTPLDGAC